MNLSDIIEKAVGSVAAIAEPRITLIITRIANELNQPVAIDVKLQIAAARASIFFLLTLLTNFPQKRPAIENETQNPAHDISP